MIYLGVCGKQAKREDPRTLKLAKYLQLDRLALPPATLDWSKQHQYPMFRNDTIGDCTCAAAGHAVLDWCANSGQEAKVSEKDIVRAYTAVSGYNPETGENDQGAVMLDVLTHWRNVGIGDHRIFAFAEVDTKNIVELEMACHWFGGLYVGLALPISAQNQDVWDVPAGGAVGDGEKYSWGGHAVHVNAYDAGWPTIVTWGQKQRLTWQWMLTYCDEAYAVLSQDWLDRTGIAPNGFDLAALKKDLDIVSQLET